MDLENIEYLLKSGLPVDGSDVEELVKQYRASHVANVKLMADNRRYMQRIAALDGGLDNLRAAIDEANAQEPFTIIDCTDFENPEVKMHFIIEKPCIVELYRRPIPAQSPAEDAIETIRFDYVNADGNQDSKMITHDEMRQRYAELRNHCYMQSPAVPDDYMLVRSDVIDFLNGSGELIGCGFGEKPDGERGNYWWRRFLPDVNAKSSVVQKTPAVAAPDDNPNEWIIEKLSYHKLERNDLNIDGCLNYLESEWKEIQGRTTRQLVMQILELLAAAPSPRITEQEFSYDEYICIRDAVDRLISAVGKDVDGDQSECSLFSEFIDELITDVINPLKIRWYETDHNCGYSNSIERITEQDALQIIKSWSGYFDQETFEMWIMAKGRALFDKLNGTKS